MCPYKSPLKTSEIRKNPHFSAYAYNQNGLSLLTFPASNPLKNTSNMHPKHLCHMYPLIKVPSKISKIEKSSFLTPLLVHVPNLNNRHFSAGIHISCIQTTQTLPICIPNNFASYMSSQMSPPRPPNTEKTTLSAPVYVHVPHPTNR